MSALVLCICLSGVNCYLVSADRGFALIDTGLPERREDLARELEKAGCVPGALRLIILTHGDYDHAGNAAYLRATYGVPIAMHRMDAKRVETADWSLGFKARPDKFDFPFSLISRFIKPGRFEVFSPDLYLDEGQELAAYGIDASILYLPGHTKGSIGVLTSAKELFCGDLLANMVRPGLHFFLDDIADARMSVMKIESVGARAIHPGHGKAFLFSKMRPIGK